MIYNITNPTAPYFVQYINSRNFTVTPNQSNLATVGDLGPEGIVFIPAAESPTGENMIMLSNEVSATVSFFSINTPLTEGITKIQDYKNNTSPTIGTYKGINFKEAGFSALFPIPNTNGTEFWTCSDRGVNVDCANANTASCRPTYDKMYAFPSYSPKIHRIRIKGDSIQIVQTITIKRPNGTGASGIINPTGLGSTATEVASTDTVLDCANFNLKTTPKDTFGIDPEGLVVDKEGNFWLCEEGGATIWKLNANGVLIKRYTPYANLAGVQSVDVQIDTVFKYRKNNRGFEGISIAPNGKIYAMIQSGILYPTATVGNNSRVHRILEIDPATNNQRMLVYLNDGIIGTGANQIRLQDWKIGDMAAVNDSIFLVLEAAARGTTDIKRLYQININQATPVTSGLYGGLTLEALVDSTGLANNGIKAVTKTLVMDLLASGWPAVLDKAEGLAIINDSTIAIGNDNDFGQTSPLANGIPTATGNLSHLITYRLSGARKLANYTPSTLSVSSQTSYLTPVASGVKFNSILTAGDAINGYKMVGTPDGAGAFDNGNGTFTLLVNHEFGSTAGVTRAHGAKGALVSKWIINKNDLSVVSGSDLIQKVNIYTPGIGYTLYNPADTTAKKAFNRFCSADLPAVSAFYNATTGLGTQERIFMNGEESGAEGRAFGHIVTGANAGTTYELPALGKFSWENSVANPKASDKTIVVGTDDATPGQVYIYIGTKTNTGSEVDKAGLTNGKLYGVAVTGLTTETSGSFPAANTAFTLVDLGNVKDSSGASINTRSNNLGVTNFLRPEDAAWDPSNLNDLYFVTTNAFNSPSRMWRLRFTDINNPTAGGTITAVLDGTEGTQMMDNIGIDNFGHVLIQEDPGNQSYIAKVWQYTIATDKLDLVAQHDTTRFLTGAPNFLTQDEESSGIIDVQEILGAGNFLLVDQAHYAVAGEQVEGGQILKMFNPTTANAFAGASPSSSQSPYLTPRANGVKFNSILTAGDVVNGYKMVGTPDGAGAFDNGNGTFTLLVNHEFGSTAGVTRAHGAKGALVSKWIINKNDLSVVSGSDLIQKVNIYTPGIGYTLYNPADTTAKKAFNRFCSADLPAVSAFYNATTGLGTQERIFMNGEESGAEGRAFGHIVTGANAGTTYELPALGKFSWENSVANPKASDKTIVVGTDDATPGQVYIYIGTKTNTGSEVDKAGLTNGKLYGVAVTGLTTETSGSFPAANTAFTLVDLGNVKDSSGASINTRSNNLGVTNFLRPEDAAWDPSNLNDLYFVTTNAFNSPSRMWRLRFTDINNPTAGGTITAVLDGTEGTQMMDNIGIDNFGHVLIQEDPGNQSYIAKVWQYTIATDKLDLVAQHDTTRFLTGAPNFLTQDEESSGIIDVQEILGAGNFLLVDQAHYAVAGEQVEGGQILKMFNPTTANSKPLISIGAARAINNDTVKVRGVVTRAWGRFIYIQDGTGAIGVRQSSGAMVDSITSGGLKEGDSVEVVGGRSNFNNYSQIQLVTGAYGENTRVTKISSNVALPAPMVVTIDQINTAGEQYESKLIRVVGLRTASTGNFTASTNYTVWDGSTPGDTMLLRVISATDTEIDDAPATAIPAGLFTFEGTLIQFCSSPTSGCTLGYQLQGVRKKEIISQLTPFNLSAPATETKVITNDSSNTPVSFVWNKSLNATAHKWFITAATGNYATPWATGLASIDTTINYSIKQLDTLVASKGVNKGDSVLLKWTAYAYLGADSMMASQSYNIWIVREKPVVLLGAFNLLAPANNTRIEVEQNETTPIVVTWTASKPTATYKWLLAAANGTFANPLLVLASDNNGLDTKLTLTAGAVDSILASKGVIDGDSIALQWTVRAYENTDSLQASQTFGLVAVRLKAVGLYEASLHSQLTLYPNPTNGNSNLSFTLTNSETLNISITDMQGKEAMNAVQLDGVSGDNNIELPTAGLKSGIYFVTLSSNSKSDQIKLVVIH